MGISSSIDINFVSKYVAASGFSCCDYACCEDFHPVEIALGPSSDFGRELEVVGICQPIRQNASIDCIGLQGEELEVPWPSRRSGLSTHCADVAQAGLHAG